MKLTTYEELENAIKTEVTNKFGDNLTITFARCDMDNDKGVFVSIVDYNVNNESRYDNWLNGTAIDFGYGEDCSNVPFLAVEVYISFDIWDNNHQIANWEDFWGGKYDLAQDLEDFYEEKMKKSAVFWTPFDGNGYPTDKLEGRPESYATCGYTSDFEDWGQKSVQEAVDNHLTNADEIYTYITNKDF